MAGDTSHYTIWCAFSARLSSVGDASPAPGKSRKFLMGLIKSVLEASKIIGFAGLLVSGDVDTIKSIRIRKSGY
jgi:hypothetical protein